MFANSPFVDARHAHFNHVQGSQYNFFGASHDVFKLMDGASVLDAQYNANNRDTLPCHPGTRTDILGLLTQWSSSDREPPICWLYGEAGYGKSAIAQSVAQICASRPVNSPYRLMATFFFNREHARRCTTQYVVPTLMRQLAVAVPALAPILQEVLARDTSLLNAVFEDQVQKLVIEVLHDLPATESSGVVIFDGIDECREAVAIGRLIRLLASRELNPNLPLRVLVTSRPEPALRHMSRDISLPSFVLNLRDFAANDDIRVFLTQKLQVVRQTRVDVMIDVPTTWPSSDELGALVRKASGMFIYAFTAANFISDARSVPQEQLALILGASNLGDKLGRKNWGHTDLDRLYKQILSKSPSPPETLQVISVVMFVQTRLSPRQLALILDLPFHRVQLALEGLHSILSIPEDPDGGPVTTLHLSLQEFVTSKDRSGEYFIDPPSAHAHLAGSCLLVISKALAPFSYLTFRNPSSCLHAITDFTCQPNNPTAVATRYACRYWTYHLTHSPTTLNDDLRAKLWLFCRHYIVPWQMFLALDGQPISFAWSERGFLNILFLCARYSSPLLILTWGTSTSFLHLNISRVAVAGLIATMTIEQCMVERFPPWLVWPLALALVQQVIVNGLFTYQWSLMLVGLLVARVNRRIRRWRLAFALTCIAVVLQALHFPRPSRLPTSRLHLLGPYAPFSFIVMHLKVPDGTAPMRRVQWLLLVAMFAIVLIQSLGIFPDGMWLSALFVLLSIQAYIGEPVWDTHIFGFLYSWTRDRDVGLVCSRLVAGLYVMLAVDAVAGRFPALAAGVMGSVVAGLNGQHISKLMQPLGTLPRGLQAHVEMSSDASTTTRDPSAYIIGDPFDCPSMRFVAGLLAGILAGLAAGLIDGLLGAGMDLRFLLGPLAVAAYVEDLGAFRAGGPAYTEKMGVLSQLMFVQALRYVEWLGIASRMDC